MFDENQIIPNENVVDKARQFNESVSNQLGRKVKGQLTIFIVECCNGHNSSLVVDCGSDFQVTPAGIAKMQAEFSIWCHEAIKAITGEEDESHEQHR